MAAAMNWDPATDYERSHGDEPAAPALRLCVKCRAYLPQSRMSGSSNGGFVCDACVCDFCGAGDCQCGAVRGAA